MFIPAKIKNGTPRRGVISNHHRYRAIGELKCPILILQRCIRFGRKWDVPEIIALQREYELLELSIEQIAEKHKRSPNAIMRKLDKDGFAV
jgi:hypothetical protein